MKITRIILKLLLLLWFILDIIIKILSVIAALIAVGFGFFSILALICLIIGFLLKLPNKWNMIGIMVVAYIIKIIILLVIGIFQNLLDTFHEKIKNL